MRFTIYEGRFTNYDLRFTIYDLRPEAKPNGAKLITINKKIPKE